MIGVNIGQLLQVKCFEVFAFEICNHYNFFDMVFQFNYG
jgi:hypothetical protein